MSSEVRRRFKEPSQHFERWHRQTLPADFKVMDLDKIYYGEGGQVYLIAEIITILNGGLDDALENYPIWTHKREVLESVSEELGVPAVVVWHEPPCEEFIIKNLETEETVRVDEEGYRRIVEIFRAGGTK